MVDPARTLPCGGSGRLLRVAWLLAWTAFLLVLGGCSVRSSRREGPSNVERIGSSVLGRPIEARVFPGELPPALMIAGIHGSEESGAQVLEALARRLEDEPEARAGRALVLIPRANPDGLAWHIRSNARGVDINRNFPARSFVAGPDAGPRPASEPETRAILDAIARWRPAAIISVHAPLACIDPDGGPASTALARRMVGLLPFRDLAPLPGSLGSYAGVDCELAMVTFELDRERLPYPDAQAYLEASLGPLLAALGALAEDAFHQ